MITEKEVELNDLSTRRLYLITTEIPRLLEMVKNEEARDVMELHYLYGMTVDAVALVEMGILKNVLDGVRILGNGELTKKLTVKAQGFSKTAIQKIEAAGGSHEVI